LFPLLDVGSSTYEFRLHVQPHIDAEIFAPLRERGGRVWHVDIKQGSGVDLVGDLLDPAFRARLLELKVRSAMICNILHHLTDPRPVVRATVELVPSGGYIIASGPHRYPRHFDPIDTMFRPSIEEAAALFPGTEIVDAAIIDAGNWRNWNSAERGGRSLLRTMVRLAVPFYRPRKWWELARQSPYLIKHAKAFALVLRKR
jgi:hypothetical protein